SYRSLAALPSRLLGLLGGLLPGRHASPPYRVSGEPLRTASMCAWGNNAPSKTILQKLLEADSEQPKLVGGAERFCAQPATTEVHGELFVEAQHRVRQARSHLLGVTTELLEVGVVGEREDGVDLQPILEAAVHRPTRQRGRLEFAQQVLEAMAAGRRGRDDDRWLKSWFVEAMMFREITAEFPIHFRHAE